MSNTILLNHVHFCLVSLSYYNSNSWAAEESLIEDWDFKGLLNKEWGTEILSDRTFKQLNKFRKEWLAYKSNTNYAGDLVFMFFDDKWREIIRIYLIPALKSIEKDFELNKVEYFSFEDSIDLDSYPTSDDILKRGATLYKLLLNNKIVKKTYMI